MRQPITDAEKKRRADFGSLLKSLREKHQLGVREMERHLGVSSGRLSAVEKGDKQCPPEWLALLAGKYDVELEDLVRMRYWPQLILLPLIRIVDPDNLSRILIEEIERGLGEPERQMLTGFLQQFVEGLLQRPSAVNQR